MAFQISLTSTSSIFSFEYTEGIQLNGPYEVCLKSFVTYNNIPNISEWNNRITFIEKKTNGPSNDIIVDENNNNNDIIQSNGGETQNSNINITIPKGTYEIHDLAKYIENQPALKNSKTYFHLNKNTFKMEMYSKLSIDLSVEHSVARTLGFTPRLYEPQKIHISDLTVEIFTVQTIRVKCNLIKCNVNNLKLNDNTLYEFPLRCESGEKIVERPQTLCYYPVTRMDSLYRLHLKIVDQDDNIVDFRGEQISITLGFQPCK